jgi:phosphomannomutase
MKVSVCVLRIQEYMSKTKIELTPQIDVDAILVAMTEKYKRRILLPLTE